MVEPPATSTPSMPSATPAGPASTYRLQLHADFGFADAASRLDYLARLGVSHLYLSPILQAAPGSMHGYDVVDHAQVSADLGGLDGYLSLVTAAHERDLGVVVDVVPNHMAITVPAYLNSRWWDVLRRGRASDSARWFDIDWDLWDGRVGLPLLDSPLHEVLAGGGLRLDRVGDRPVLRYGDQLLPVADGTEHLRLPELVEHQHYRLGAWREPTSLGYRRFFDVDSLVAIRVEDEEVFDASHAVLLGLYRQGLLDGFRIDHPDGLADPEGYLERLRDRTGGAWVIVEKVLTAGERLPDSWPCAGTTGYDALQAVSAALVPPTGAFLSATWRQLGGEPSLVVEEERAKRQVVDELLQPELLRLVRCASAIVGQRIGAAELGQAFAALLGHVEVYRAYLRLDEPPSADARRRLDRLVDGARGDRPDLGAVLDQLRELLADTMAPDPAIRELVVRFQQVCGPVMAKGVEDTTFYRWHRLAALEEVGGDPRALDEADQDALHRWAAHQLSSYPTGMTTLSTHDTKRSEDVRARLLSLAGDTAGWAAGWAAVRGTAEEIGLDLPTGYLLFQTLLGAWPIDPERLHEYLRKAVREAKLHTSWREPVDRYERLVAECADRCLAGPVAGTIGDLVESNREPIRATTLAAKLVALTMPGVSDTYQGCETVQLALVDPDNRRPVDFDRLGEMLAELDGGRPPKGLEEEKVWLTSRVLRLRRLSPELFGAAAPYRPLPGSAPEMLGFCRGDRLATLVTRWPVTVQRDGWGDTSVPLPAGRWTDVLSRSSYDVGSTEVPCRDLFDSLPVALLRRVDR